MKNLLSIFLCSFLAATFGFAQDETLFPDPIIAKGKGVQVKQSDLDDAFIAYKSSLAARGQTIPETQRDELEKRLLEKLIVTQILVQKASPSDLKRATNAANKVIEDSQNRFSSVEMFKQQLLASGLTFEKFRNKLLEQAICEEVMERELTPTIKITDEEVRKFYQENPDRFLRPEMVRASHILISTVDPETKRPLPAEEQKKRREKIEEIRERALAGEDFARLAKDFSQDPASKDKGGEYTFARGEMVKPFESAAFSLQTNQISSIVETVYGYHIIKLHEKLSPKKSTLDEVASDIQKGLTQREMQKRMNDYFERVKTEAGVETVRK